VVLAGDFAVQVQEGESLREGQRLALAANRGVRVNLYLELRDLGRPIDPAPWLRPEKAVSQGSGFRRETG
jgi:septal ring factor EnvC (AmiA/AmiB activator)